MKKNFFILAVSLLTTISTVFAENGGSVNEKIAQTFNKEFVGATQVNWEHGKTFAKATFTLNGQIMFAYYTMNGEQLAVTRNLFSSQLPITLLADLKKDYSNYWISDLFEMSTANESAYYIKLESSDHSLVLKATIASGWQLYKKERKD